MMAGGLILLILSRDGDQQQGEGQPTNGGTAPQAQPGQAPATYPPPSTNQQGAAPAPANDGYDEKYGF